MAKEDKKTVKAHCPTCDGERVCDVHWNVYKSWDWEDGYGNSVNGGVDHSLLECRGCETVFYETTSWNTEDIEPYYDADGEPHHELNKTKETSPKPKSKSKPAWLDAMRKIDWKLYSILNEMYLAHDNRSYILTAIGLRTALDRATEVLRIDPALTFAKKLTALKDGGWIGDTEKDILGVVTDAGNAAAHRGWEPDSSEIAQLLSAMDVFLQRAFIVGQKALGIKNSIPDKPRRQKGPAATAPAAETALAWPVSSSEDSSTE
jgi:hypothetical protein